MKTLHCADAGFDCPAVIHANTNEEVLTQAAEHAHTVHGVSVTPDGRADCHFDKGGVISCFAVGKEAEKI